MPGPVTDAHRIMFRDNFIMATQEKRGMFDDAFMFDGSLSGKQVQMCDIIGTVDARVDAPEGSDTPDIKPSHEPVWVRPQRIEWGQLMSKEDAVKGLTIPNSKYINVGVSAITRRRNLTLSAALLGNRLIGNEVPTVTPWAGLTVPIGGVGMTVDKFATALKLLQDQDVDLDEEEIYATLDPQEELDLTRDPKFTSKDYRDTARFEQKTLRQFMGVNIIPYRRIPDAAANQSQAVFWAKSGMAWGTFMPLEVTTMANPAKEYREQPYAETYIGATRLEDAKVVRVINAY